MGKVKITDKMRLDYLVGEVRFNWPYRSRSGNGPLSRESWTLTFPFQNRHGLRAAIDAAIRASRRGKKS